MPQLPDWLAPADPAAEWLRGAQLGAQIGSERARLQEEQTRAQMETQARQETLQRQTQFERARIATENARIQAETGLREQRLQEIQAANAERTKAAAMKWAAQQSYARDRQSGLTAEQALYKNPGLLTPQALSEARKEDSDFVQQQLDIATKKQALAEQREARLEAGKTKPATMTYKHYPKADATTPDYEVSGSPESVAPFMGTNAPTAAFRNLAPAAAQSGPAPSAPANTGPPLIQSQDQYDSLPAGSTYLFNGQLKRKAGAKTQTTTSDAGDNE